MLSLLSLILFIFSRVAAADTYDIFKGPTITKPGCPTQCGNLTVPYPFGVGVGCGIGKYFEFNCSNENTPRALIGNIQIYNISDQHMRISSVVARSCYDGTDSITLKDNAMSSIAPTTFSYSELNKFTVVGCDDIGIVFGSEGRNFTGGCISLCSNADDVINGSCSGIGCCQTSLPKGLKRYDISMGNFFNHVNVSSFNPCSHGFFGEDSQFEFRGVSLVIHHKRE